MAECIIATSYKVFFAALVIMPVSAPSSIFENFKMTAVIMNDERPLFELFKYLYNSIGFSMATEKQITGNRKEFNIRNVMRKKFNIEGNVGKKRFFCFVLFFFYIYSTTVNCVRKTHP